MAKRGRKPVYDNVEELEAGIERYFEWVENTPVYVTEAKTVSQGGNMGSEIEMVGVPRRRYPSIYSLARFLGFRYSGYADLKQRPEFADILDDAERRIKDEKLSGAAQNEFNSNIVARDIGLSEKSESKVEQTNYHYETTPAEARRALLDNLSSIAERLEAE